MITFDPREPAPPLVRWTRVIAPLVMCFAYLTLRVAPATHDRIGLTELLTSGVMFVGLTFVAFIALGDLLYPATPAEQAMEDDPEGTGVFGQISGDLLATEGGNWPGRAEVKREIIARAYGYDPATEEPELLTHGYTPMHHTPARGIPAVTNVYAPGAPGAASLERLTGRVPSPYVRESAGGRHRRAGA